MYIVSIFERHSGVVYSSFITKNLSGDLFETPEEATECAKQYIAEKYKESKQRFEDPKWNDRQKDSFVFTDGLTGDTYFMGYTIHRLEAV